MAMAARGHRYPAPPWRLCWVAKAIWSAGPGLCCRRPHSTFGGGAPPVPNLLQAASRSLLTPGPSLARSLPSQLTGATDGWLDKQTMPPTAPAAPPPHTPHGEPAAQEVWPDFGFCGRQQPLYYHSVVETGAAPAAANPRTVTTANCTSAPRLAADPGSVGLRLQASPPPLPVDPDCGPLLPPTGMPHVLPAWAACDSAMAAAPPAWWRQPPLLVAARMHASHCALPDFAQPTLRLLPLGRHRSLLGPPALKQCHLNSNSEPQAMLALLTLPAVRGPSIGPRFPLYRTTAPLPSWEWTCWCCPTNPSTPCPPAH